VSFNKEGTHIVDQAHQLVLKFNEAVKLSNQQLQEKYALLTQAYWANIPKIGKSNKRFLLFILQLQNLKVLK